MTQPKRKERTMSNQAPIQTLRDGKLKAAIWKNEGDKGTFYTVQLSRLYEKEGKLHESDSFSNGDLLKIAHLATRAYDAIARMRSQDKAAA